MERALGGYVNAVGGSKAAARRMGTSRGVAADVIGLVRDFQAVGPTAALARFSLQATAGRPAQEVFTRLIDELCPPGGSVDEAIARAGLLDAIEQLAQAELTFEELTPDQLELFLADFITGTIEARVLNDIGTRSIALPEDVAAVNNIQQQLHDAISGCVRQAISGKVNAAATLTNADIQRLVDDLYSSSFDLLIVLAEAA